MGRHRHIDERGISAFEVAIIVLILMLVGFSCYAVMKKINQTTKKNYNNAQQVHTPGE